MLLSVKMDKEIVYMILFFFPFKYWKTREEIVYMTYMYVSYT
jgi:hypothetical protein